MGNQWVRVGSNQGYVSFTTITLPEDDGVDSDVNFKLDGDNYNKSVFRILHDGADLDGIDNGIHGKVIYIYNGDRDKDLKLVGQGSSSSSNENKFLIVNVIVLKPGSSVILIYDGLYFNKWLVNRSDN